MGTILGVVSAKGGVGKTTIVANLGVALSKEFKKNVLAVDGNITAPNLALYLEMIRPSVTIYDVLEKNIPITHAIFTHGTGLDVVPGSIRELEPIGTDNLGFVIGAVSDQYDLVLLDSGPSVGDDVMSVLKASDELLIVTVPEFLIVATTYKTINLARTLGKPIRGIILNKVRGKKYEMTANEIEETVGLPVIGVIKEDSRIRESVNHGLSVIEQYPKSSSSKEFKTLAAGLIGEEYISGFFAKIKMMFSIWKDLLFRREETKVEQWKRRGEEIWADEVKTKTPERKREPAIEIRPVSEPEPAPRPEPVIEPEPKPEPEPTVEPEPEPVAEEPTPEPVIEQEPMPQPEAGPVVEPEPEPVAEEPTPKPAEEPQAEPQASPNASKIRLLEIEKRSLLKMLGNPKIQGGPLEKKYTENLDEINKKLKELR